MGGREDSPFCWFLCFLDSGCSVQEVLEVLVVKR